MPEGLCNAGREMTGSQAVAGNEAGEGMLVLGVDTCGPSGTVALTLWVDGVPEILGQKELAGGTYSATLVSSVGELMGEAGTNLSHIDAIVVVNGPGSFTGVRVGLSAVKGLAEPRSIPVVAVSRLAVLSAKASAPVAALDAHRKEVYLRLPEMNGARELLAGADDLATIGSPEGEIVVCEEAAGLMLQQVWPEASLLRTLPPTAADAIEICLPSILAGQFADVATLDGHYLRRSDAEIFGEAAKAKSDKGVATRVRRMEAGDIDAVMEIAAKTDHAPGWGRSAFEAAIDPGNQPRRVALVAEREVAGLAGFVVASVLPGGEGELESIVTAFAHQRRGVARELFAVLKTELRRQGVREVMLEVREGNHSAQGFYRFLGFREDGRRPGYYADPAEDAVLMRLLLK